MPDYVTPTGAGSCPSGRRCAAQPGHLDTLAAAYAETGQFAQAVSTQRQALAALATPDAGLRGELERRLQSYRQAQVWRE